MSQMSVLQANSEEDLLYKILIWIQEYVLSVLLLLGNPKHCVIEK